MCRFFLIHLLCVLVLGSLSVQARNFPVQGTFVDEHASDATRDLRALWRFEESDTGLILRDWSYLAGNNPLDLQFVTTSAFPSLNALPEPSGQEWLEGELKNGAYQFPTEGIGFFRADLNDTNPDVSERFNLSGNMTIIFHVKFDARSEGTKVDFGRLGAAKYQRIVSTKKQRGNGSKGFEIEYDADKDKLKFNGFGGEQLVVEGANLADGAWHWIAITLEYVEDAVNGDYLAPLVYIDTAEYAPEPEGEVAVASASIQSTTESTENVTVGVYNGWPELEIIEDGGFYEFEETPIAGGNMKPLGTYTNTIIDNDGVLTYDLPRISVGNRGMHSLEYPEHATIGGNRDRQFGGQLQELRIYGSVLTYEEIVSIMSPPGPYWWYTYGAVDPRLFADDYAAANLGQIKQFASASRDYLDELLASKMGVASADSGLENSLEVDSVNSTVSAQVDAFSTDVEVNKIAARIGQAKHVAATQFDFLSDLGYTTDWFGQIPFDRTVETGHSLNYPWTETTTDDEDTAAITLGQLKYIFYYEFENYLDYDHDNDGVSDYVEIYQGGTPTSDLNPDNPDTDLDDMWDGWEIYWNFPYLDPALTLPGGYGRNEDPDNDGLTNYEESAYKQSGGEPYLNPFDPDSDGQVETNAAVSLFGDGMWDSYEITYGLNPLSDQNDPTGNLDGPDDDLDGDEVSNLDEFTYENPDPTLFPDGRLNPTYPDSDNDGMWDGWEITFGLPALDNAPNIPGGLGSADDPDNDGATNAAEAQYAQIGLKMNPFSGDSDGDQMWDGFELAFDLLPVDDAPSVPGKKGRLDDPDEDGMSNLEEFIYNSDRGIFGVGGLSPRLADTDGDEMPDGWEIAYNFNPLLNSGNADDGPEGNPDGDQYTNLQEYILGFNPLFSDDPIPGESDDPLAPIAYAPLSGAFRVAPGTDKISPVQEEILEDLLEMDLGDYVNVGDIDGTSEHSVAPVILQGELGVSPNGATTYSLPIDIAPGVANFQPSLALSYNSQGGNGYLGLGWSLQGLSAISRAPLDKIHDDTIRPVSFTDEDALTLDGQRLIPIDTHHGGSVIEYRTEIDTFSRIASYGHTASGPTSFKVWTKSGQMMEYGLTENSRFVPKNKTVPLVWHLERVSDTFGNSYEIEYRQFGDTKESYPHRISYTANPSQLESTELYVDFHYKFRDEKTRGYMSGATLMNHRVLERIVSRKGSTVHREYQMRYEQSQVSKVSRIVAISLRTEKGGGDYYALPIAFDYTDELLRSNTDAPLTAFDPSDLDLYEPSVALIPADWNGDGLTDILTVGPDADLKIRTFNGTDFSGEIAQPYADLNDTIVASGLPGKREYLAGDFNADGMVDLFCTVSQHEAARPGRPPQAPMGYVWVFLNQGGGVLGPANLILEVEKTDNYRDLYIALDMDGDGRSDIVRTGEPDKESTETKPYLGVDVWYSDGAGLSARSSLIDDFFYDFPEPIRSRPPKNYRYVDATIFGDYNGDGLADLGIAHYLSSASADSISIDIFINQDGALVKRETVTSSGTDRNSKFLATDLNSDGLSEIVSYIHEDEVGFKYHLNNGESFQDQKFFSDIQLESNNLGFVQFADLNGDGVSDLTYLNHDDELKTTYFQQSGVDIVAGETIAYSNYGINDDNDKLLRMPFADYDGDGHVDVSIITGRINGENLDTKDFYYWDSDGPRNDLLNTIVGGFGVTTEIEYKLLTDPTVYQKGSGATYPQVDLIQPMPVVSRLVQPDGVGGTYNVDYRYACLTADVDRGLEGFGAYASTNSRTNQTVITRHKKGFPFTGVAETIETFEGGTLGFVLTADCIAVAGGKLLNRSTKSGFTHWTYHGDKVHFAYASTENVENFEYNSDSTEPFQEIETVTVIEAPGTTAGQYTFGNASSVKTDYKNGRYKRVVNTYDDYAGAPPATISAAITNLDRWYLGRLRDSTVTFHDNGVEETRSTSFQYYVDVDETAPPGVDVNPGIGTGALRAEFIIPTETNPTYDYTQGTYYEYHWSGQISKTKVVANDITYDPDGATPISEVSETRSSRVVYSDDGRFPEFTYNVYDHEASATFDPLSGVVLSETDINGLTTYSTYGSFQRLKRVDAPIGDDTVVESWTMSVPELSTTIGPAAAAYIPADTAFAKLTRSTGLAPDSVVFYDCYAREFGTLNFNGDGDIVVTHKEFDTNGRLKRESIPYIPSQETAQYLEPVYDDVDRIESQYVPGLGNTHFVYDGLSKETYRQIEDGYTAKPLDTSAGQTDFLYSREVYDESERIDYIEDSAGQYLFYQYDGWGNVVEVIKSLNDTVEPTDERIVTTYNSLGHRTAIDDPDMGVWSYLYNGFGELVRQTDAKSQETWMAYDQLGRLVSRLDADDTQTTWVYDDISKGKALGKLTYTQVLAPNGTDIVHSESYLYTNTAENPNPLGLLVEKTETILGKAEPYVMTMTYDNYGREHTVTYPTQFEQDGDGTPLTLANTYDSTYGHIERVTNYDPVLGVDNSTYWQTEDKNATVGRFDAQGRLLAFSYGNGVKTELEIDSVTGFLDRIRTDKTSDGSKLGDWHFGYNALGHLMSREDDRQHEATPNHHLEKYTYDTLQRLSTHKYIDPDDETNVIRSDQYEYDDYGNITARPGLVTSYSYDDADRVNRLTSINGGSNFTYDNNGNLTDYDGRDITWNSYNKVNTITMLTRQSAFTYGVGRQRITQAYTDSSDGSYRNTTYIMGGIYEEVASGVGGTESESIQRVYISAPTGTVGVFVSDNGANPQMDYYHYDHQGTIIFTTDASGNKQEDYAYDPWGRRSSTSNWDNYLPILDHLPAGLIASATTRGYTGHEMMDAFGLINMNGRVYDPTLGRFLSADPFVQFEGDLQTYNRYSYVRNNPLSYTDPSGYFIEWVLFGAFAAVAGQGLPAEIQPFVGLALAFIPGGQGALLANGQAAFYGYSITSGYINGGVKGAILADLSFGLTKFIGGPNGFGGFGNTLNEAARAVAHGLAQGGVAELGGGDFGAGFLGGAVGSLGGSLTQHYQQSPEIGLAVSIMAGGTASSLGGGSFANGAISGATTWLFNHMADIRADERRAKLEKERAAETKIRRAELVAFAEDMAVRHSRGEISGIDAYTAIIDKIASYHKGTDNMFMRILGFGKDDVAGFLGDFEHLFLMDHKIFGVTWKLGGGYTSRIASTGIKPKFEDGTYGQLAHFSGSLNAGATMGSIAHFWVDGYEIFATHNKNFQDFRLGRLGVNIGELVGSGDLPLSQLGDVIKSRLGE
ncbi:MAG: RHS repeat-associated core domain-containing protein [Opitutales bacterium]